MGDVEVLASIPQLARLAGRSRSSMFRLLLRLHAQDVEQHGQCDWLIRTKAGAKLRVNVSRLEKAHPALFRTRYVSREEIEDLEDRVLTLEKKVERSTADQNKRLNAVAASVRVLKSSLKPT